MNLSRFIRVSVLDKNNPKVAATFGDTQASSTRAMDSGIFRLRGGFLGEVKGKGLYHVRRGPKSLLERKHENKHPSHHL